MSNAEGYIETDEKVGREFTDKNAQAVADWAGTELLWASDTIEGRRPYLSLDTGDGVVLEVNVGDRVRKVDDGFEVVRNPLIVHERDENTVGLDDTDDMDAKQRARHEKAMGEDEAKRKDHEVGIK